MGKENFNKKVQSSSIELKKLIIFTQYQMNL